MPAIILAAMTPLEMISGREDRAALIIGVEVKRRRILPDFPMEEIENFARILRKLSVISQPFEAALTEAGRFKFLRHKMEDVGWHPGLVTPAVSFVGLPCGDPATVWVAAKRAALFGLEGDVFVPGRGWFVQHVGLQFGGGQTAFALKGNHSGARRGHKKSRDHSRGSEGGHQHTAQTSSSFPHPIVGAIACRRLPVDGLDEREISRSSGFEVILLASPYRNQIAVA
jgi:hypothetical protein